MYKFQLDERVRYDCEELIKLFLKPEEYEIIDVTDDKIGEDKKSPDFKEYKNSLKRDLFRTLAEATSYSPPWGILTGVRPVKLVGEIFKESSDEESVRKRLREDYLISEEKENLLIDIYKLQQKIPGAPMTSSAALYIGIPFCPTRCLYCSFTSNQSSEDEILRYLEALKKEIRYVGRRIKETGLSVESIYIGGGTPTTLSAGQLDDLLCEVEKNLNLKELKEFTVEAGRPDTITMDKLKVISNHGIRRISINPQSMKAETLDLIGRNHKPNDIEEAFTKAKAARIDLVNADLIAGLPEESPADFKETLRRIIALEPKNITVHTLAVKRASRLVEEDPNYHYRQGEIVGEMLKIADKMLRDKGYKPYYLYRQKHMAGGFENIGWCKDEEACIYNIRIMEENQSIIALGAGAISKIFFPGENRLERIANVGNYQVYIERLDEMLQRKEDNFFKEVKETC